MVLDCVSIPTVVKALQFTLGFYVYLRVTAVDVVVDVFEVIGMDDTHEGQEEVHVEVFYFVYHEFHGGIFVKCGSVGTFGYQCGIYVADSKYPGADGYHVSFDVIGIAGTIVVFMMMKDYVPEFFRPDVFVF